MRSVPSWRALSFLPRVTACLDSAYVARYMCDIISAMGMVPRIKPNTCATPREAKPWRGMVGSCMDNREAFDSGYHQRSIIESVFAALKKMYGDCTRCRRSGQPGKGDLDPRHMLQHRTRSQITGKRRQARTGPNRSTSSVTGASYHAPFLAESPHHVLDLEDILWVVEEYGTAWVVTGRFRCMPCLWHLGVAFFITRTHPIQDQSILGTFT